MSIEAFYLPLAGGQRFCVFHSADKVSRTPRLGQVVFVHPLAEEMNKSRRMASLQARALAQAGFDVLQIDLLGCGDSSGDFADATWADWVGDVTAACNWLKGRTTAGFLHGPQTRLWLWGLRAGCLVAAQAAQSMQEPCNFLFWAPTSSGKLLLQQFLRLNAASSLARGNVKAAMENLRADLAQGRSVEIAGYCMASALAEGLAQANLTPPDAGIRPGRVEWFEMSTRPQPNLTPTAANGIADWQQAGYDVRSHMVIGPSFWQTSEIEDAAALITATTSSLLGASLQ